jgi:hypothetical protein
MFSFTLYCCNLRLENFKDSSFLSNMQFYFHFHCMDPASFMLIVGSIFGDQTLQQSLFPKQVEDQALSCTKPSGIREIIQGSSDILLE